MFGIRFFRGAGATGHVFFLKNGSTADKGPAYSWFVGPQTTIVVVPTTPRILEFSVKTRTKDMQGLEVSGNITVSLDPDSVITAFDFTVDSSSGSYLKPWEKELRAIVIERVQGPIHTKAGDVLVSAAVNGHESFQDAVVEAISTTDGPLAGKGIRVDSCSIVKIEPIDPEVQESIGATEREALLSEADLAMHKRRMEASANERAVLEYEAATALKLEQDRADLIATQGENSRKESEFVAEATTIRLAPFTAVAAGKILGAALLKFAEDGRVGTLAIGPEMLVALNSE